MYKICYVTSISSTLNAFVKDFALYLIEKENVNVTFICSYDSEFEKLLYGKVNYIPVKIERGFKLSGLRSIFRLYKIFKKEKFDVIQYSTPNASFYASIASFLAKTKFRIYAQWGILYVGSTGIKRLILKTFEKITCKLSTRIYPDSYGNLEYSISNKLYKQQKAKVLGNGSASGVNFRNFDINSKNKWNMEIRELYSIDSSTIVIGFVGRIVRDKGIVELLSSFSRLIKDYSNIKLLIVGGNKDEIISNKIDQFLKFEYDKNVIFCGKTQEIKKYYASFDIFTLPSYREGFGSVIIEAQAMMVPVIVSNIPGPNEIIEHKKNGLIIEKKSVDSLYLSLKELIDDYNFRIELANNGYLSAINKYNQNDLFNSILFNLMNLLKETNK
jgi:glycosyltransferase involved in cell wall biosynthesis